MRALMRLIGAICYSLSLGILNKCVVPHVGVIGLASFLAPCVGFFARPSSCIGVWLIRTLFSLTGFSLSTLFVHIPTLAGSLVLSSDSKLLKISVPLFCMGAFIAHPVGAESFLYTLYWIIPAILGCFSGTSIFLRSLASTLTTHAVGSCIFLYTHTTTSTFWNLLIAQVWYERLLSTCVLVVAYKVITHVITVLSAISFERKTICQNRLASL